MQPLSPLSLAFVETLFERFLHDPEQVPDDWRSYFQQLSRDNGDLSRFRPSPSFRPSSVFNPNGHGATAAAPTEQGQLQQRVDGLVYAYRAHGHLAAHLDPLAEGPPAPPALELAAFGLGEPHLEQPFWFDFGGVETSQTLRHILAQLCQTYCGAIGIEFVHIEDAPTRQWVQQRVEGTQGRAPLSRDQRLRILERLVEASEFEDFLLKKFVGAKSFSLQGAEVLVPLLDQLIDLAAQQGVCEIVMGMPHRGRLNVLGNILGKPIREIFSEFQESDRRSQPAADDVRYHLGYTNPALATASGRTIHLGMAFNPSHLEHISPLVLGHTRAKQDRMGDRERRQVMALLLHGDAAFAGEGIVQETLNLSGLADYQCGGTVHVVVNNQIGFTTLPPEGRSGVYATDAAKLLGAPVFHVNGEDPEAVARVVAWAMEYHQEFRRDVFIDLYCYRRRGHNEGDEPAFTQPLLYQKAAAHPSVRDTYLAHLTAQREITAEQAEQLAQRQRDRLNQDFGASRHTESDVEPSEPKKDSDWARFAGPDSDAPEVETGIPAERLKELLARVTEFPGDFHLHRRLQRPWDIRRQMAQGQHALDWSAAEALALASLAVDGHRVRLAGQDTQRGTFAHRHAVLHDEQNGHTYCPLQHLSADQAAVEIINSPLSEAGVLGFEYGYSLACPHGLTAWEAQFGDFANAAQVIIDQFIASAQEKWGRLSGLVLLLPHAFDGQGPEHSSARLERFLSLCARENMQVVYPTTPAQFFHVLRRQILRPWRHPLVVLTPKGLLRHPAAVSNLDDLTHGSFQRVLPDPRKMTLAKGDHVLLCTGKVYYDLDKRRQELARQDIAIIRLEQLYPFPLEPLRDVLAGVPDGATVTWVQEEPHNMGAWPYLRAELGCRLFDRLELNAVTRPEAASPATGSAARHKRQQLDLVNTALGGDADGAPL